MRAPTRAARPPIWSRRSLLASAALLGGTGAASVAAARQDRPDAIDADLVRQFVGAAHSDLEQVERLLAETPALVFAAHDWGGGDFETGLNAASHVGRRDIAEVLLDAGARVDLFALAMLGRLDLLRPIVDAFPKLLRGAGPHGFTLLHCAATGGEAAAEVVAWLEERGLTERKVPLDQSASPPSP